MIFTILNTDFEAVGIIDTYISMIWTDRYDSAGDFEFCLPMNNALLDILKEDYYVTSPTSDRVMIIEDLDIKTDVEDGAQLIVTGRSLEQILNRRIVLTKTSFEPTYDSANNATYPNLQDSIQKLLNENVINPTMTARKIPNFIFKKCEDTYVKSLTLSAQYFGEDLYSIVSTRCQEHQIGFKVTLNDSNQFVFELFNGVDRSFDQTENPYVIFSPEHDNLFNSSYYRSKSTYKNVAIVAGEEEDDGSSSDEENKYRRVITVEKNAKETYIGMDRREIFVDASDVTVNVDSDTTLTSDQYDAHLKKRGIDSIIENCQYELFEGEVEATLQYKYGRDFFIGDTVQLVDEYGHDGQAYISEFITSHDSSGISMYPTFTTLQKGEYEAYE